ncbi:MAG TPA: copper transporter [Actinomycetota bacterium]|nr:copper transporter [Actinomycetota bacterium]
MISFRYHVFTIVAIFLAVALGIAVGNAYVQPKLVNSLRNRTDVLAAELAQERDRNTHLTDENRGLIAATDLLPMLDGGALADRSVVVVTQDGADADVLTEATAALDQANARVVAVLSVTDRMLPPDQQPHPELAELLGMPATATPADVARVAAERLADRLANGPPRRGAQPGGGDLLDQLLRGQFLRFPNGYHLSEGGLSGLGGKDQTVVILSGSPDGLALSPQSFMVPLVVSLVRRGSSVAAGEAASSVDPFVETLRSSAEVDGTSLVTVDDLAWPIGGAALVLGLERSISLGQGGDYGVRGGAEAPIPPVRTAP